MYKLVLVRHGQSSWNLENRFTGWTDVDLSENGIREAESAGEILRNEGYIFDLAYTSYLKRAIHTLWKVLDRLDLNWVPVVKTWHLNERHYGVLQGLNKAETTEKYGMEQVNLWRCGFDVRPPELSTDDDRYPGKELKYKRIPLELYERYKGSQNTQPKSKIKPRSKTHKPKPNHPWRKEFSRVCDAQRYLQR